MNQDHVKNEPDTAKGESILKEQILANSCDNFEDRMAPVEATTAANSTTEESMPTIKEEPVESLTVEHSAEDADSNAENDNEDGLTEDYDYEDELHSEYDDGSGSDSSEESMQLDRLSAGADYSQDIQDAKSKPRGRKRKLRESVLHTVRQCDQCDKKYHSLNGYRTHMQRVHNQPTESSGPSRRTRRRTARASMNTSSDNRTTDYLTDPYIRCQVCAQPFITQFNYEEHMVQVHQIAPDIFQSATEAGGSTSIFCDACKRSYANLNEYTEHARIEHGATARKSTRKTRELPSRTRTKKSSGSRKEFHFEKTIPDIQCRFCLTAGFNSTSYREHLQKTHMPKLLPMVGTMLTKANFYNSILPTCEECDVTLYDNVQDCLAHYKQVHKVEYVLGQGFVYQKDALVEYLKAGSLNSTSNQQRQ